LKNEASRWRLPSVHRLDSFDPTRSEWSLCSGTSEARRDRAPSTMFFPKRDPHLRIVPTTAHCLALDLCFR
jgi:hypothetical protein